MKWLARGGLALGLLYLTIYALGYATGAIPSRLRDLALVQALFVDGLRPPLPSEQPPPAGQSYLRLTVSTGQNLIAKSVGGELNIYPIVADCANADVTLFAYGPYHQGLHVSALQRDSDNPRFEALGRAQADRYDYEIFVPIAGRLTSESDFNRPMPNYALRRERRLLCVRIGGGNMMGGHFRSNEIRLPVAGVAE